MATFKEAGLVRCDNAFFETLLSDPPDGLFLPAIEGAPSIDIRSESVSRREQQIWEGYFDAASVLLNEILAGRSFSQNLMFPAIFNLRHGMEVALKWHIRYAGGTVPKNAGHDLEILINAFRQTAGGLDEEATYIHEGALDQIAELARIDPRSVAFRYSTELNGPAVGIPYGSWDLRCLIFTVDMLFIWFDHLEGYIDMSDPAFEAMMREQVDAR